MGVWFLASAFSHYVGGLIAAGASASEAPGVAVAPTESLHIYADMFASVAWAGVGVGAVVLMLAPLLRRFMHESAPIARRER
jgi:proton-dependent oligopeptide transporter, POT family